MYNTRTESVDPKTLILPKNYNPDDHEISILIESIKAHGLLHPPLIRDDYTVFAGKKRVVACRMGGLASIECKVYPSDLEQEDYKIISLHENLKRSNLAWYEQVIQEKELHELRQSQMGPGKSGKKIGWSLRDTATELSMSFGILSEDIRLADALMADPTLKKIQDKTTAKKVIFEKIKQVNQELLTNYQTFSFETNKCYLGASEVILKMFPTNSFDACITDPPWIEYKDPSLTKDHNTIEVFKEVFRVLKNDSFLYAFVSTQDWEIYYRDFQKIGFSVQKYPLIWIKENVLTQGTKTWEYQRDYEPIILAVKGSPAKTQSVISAIMSCPVVNPGKLIHPNEKPATLIKRIIGHCSYDNALILDPFAGSFVVPDASISTGRRYIAIEKDKGFFLNGLKRLGLDPKI